jgi:multidrug efflux pump subunit AcrB
MILLFLGTWRNTLVVALSIPLSICCSLIVLSLLGQTINIMTLSGFALAVGILVDDATVTIENIDRNLAMHKPLITGILDGAQQIAVPTFVATLCICIVFLPVFFLEGTAKYLFSPLAMAVIFAMLASYLIARTVVPTFVHYLLRGQPFRHDRGDEQSLHEGDIFWRTHVRFNRQFERFRAWYQRGLEWAMVRRKTVVAIAGGLMAITACLVPFLGQDYFPQVDAGQFRLHVRAPAGTRIDETERIVTQVENVIREIIPARDLANVLDVIGPPNSPSNTANSDAEILVTLHPGHASTWDYVREIRARVNREFPECLFFTQASDIVGQVLNFGLQSPINIQIAGRDRVKNYAIAQQIAARISKVPGAVDVRVHQVDNAPALSIEVDRDRARELGLTQRDVAGNVLISLSGSAQTAANYWLNPSNGVQYPVATVTPQYRMDSIEALLSTPISSGTSTTIPQILGNVAHIQRSTTPTVINHYNVQPVYDVYANVDGRDLGGVARDVRKIVAEFEKDLPRGSFVTMRGQVQTMDQSFKGLAVGILGAIMLVYFLMVVNFQSWVDPLIIIMALPGALCGIVWILFLTGTTLSVPSLMGSIMCIGVATANAILVVTFANDQRKEGMNADAAALAAGVTRLRPVLMTALAMIIGMLPMALGLGDGGEQNAPLGRAVIGGLLLATLATLFLVPIAYSVLRRKAAHRPEEDLVDELHDAEIHPVK